MQRIFLTALLAGIIAGLFVFGVQSVKLTPLILQAEKYEDAAPHHADQETHGWEPANGFERNAWRLVADLGVGVGFALLLVGAFSLTGQVMDAKRGMLWGLAGYAVFSLAPGFGLPPELPTTLAADLSARQIWWLATAAATAGGLALIVFKRQPLFKVIGVVLLAAPHAVGAPKTPLGGMVPTELNAQFAAASLITMALFWIVLGSVSGWLYGRQSASA
ncbi:MAG: CbtA family protein [Pseudomonadota bacterium]|nr:CbtA family protein [Pseudomonadota bacterium]